MDLVAVLDMIIMSHGTDLKGRAEKGFSAVEAGT
jgi:hypothetical protein